MQKVLIQYFTGTGNTEKACFLIKDFLIKSGYETDLLRVEKNTVIPNQVYDRYIFAFPIYGFSAPSLYIDFLKKLPNLKSDTSILSINGAAVIKGKNIPGNSGSAPNIISNILKKKGYNITLIENISYPENWTQVSNPPNEIDQKTIFEKSDEKLFEFCNDFINKNQKLYKVTFMKNIIYKFIKTMFILLARRIFGKLYIADKKCNSCGFCVKICPSQTIKMFGKKPVWGSDCQACNRCINLCPQKSIQTSIFKLVNYSLIAGTLFVLSEIFICGKLQSLILINDKILMNLIIISAVILTTILFHILLLTVYDYFFRLLEKIPFLNKLFQLNFTSKFRRYKAPGFKG